MTLDSQKEIAPESQAEMWNSLTLHEKQQKLKTLNLKSHRPLDPNVVAMVIRIGFQGILY